MPQRILRFFRTGGRLSSAGRELSGMHKPVLLEEVIEYLKPENGDVILDATVGCGGHACAILGKILPNGILIGLDTDDEALGAAAESLGPFPEKSVRLAQNNFADFNMVLEKMGVDKVDGVVADLGVSSLQLDSAGRGFSIGADGPLDMRMDRGSSITAGAVVNKYREDRLSEIFWTYGEERFARRIARFIVKRRSEKPIQTTHELAGLVMRASGRGRGRARIHPATRVFQALRIEVNRELESLKGFLDKLPSFLRKGARVCVISFHSLEDRMVKVAFRKYAAEGKIRILTKKPLRPSEQEMAHNPRSRSAKMRVGECLGVEA
ncbi:MAG: 16S rRNA (cytosine(1402)-N(4))-methyltransferase RsmH [Candidatus Omnitrophota bacterium]